MDLLVKRVNVVLLDMLVLPVKRETPVPLVTLVKLVHKVTMVALEVLVFKVRKVKTDLLDQRVSLDHPDHLVLLVPLAIQHQ